jgi:hypothetical protein
MWVRQGRTDAWIAHKLDISVEQLRTFKRDQGLTGDPAPVAAPIEFTTAPETEPDSDDEALADAESLAGEESDVSPSAAETESAAAAPGDESPEREPEAMEEESEREPQRRRRRGRRGGRRRAARTADSFEATFDHGEEGYGLWLDPAVAEDETYSAHWAGHRAVSVTVEPDAITIRRVEDEDARS